jgi:hypothetical protein
MVRKMKSPRTRGLCPLVVLERIRLALGLACESAVAESQAGEWRQFAANGDLTPDEAAWYEF